MSIELKRSTQAQSSSTKTLSLSLTVEDNTFVVIFAAATSAFTAPVGYTIVFSEANPSQTQTLYALYRKITTAGTESVTLTQASSGRFNATAFVVSGVASITHETGYNNTTTASGSFSVTLTKPSADAACIWALATLSASTSSSTGKYNVSPSNDVTMQTSGASYSNGIRICSIFDDGTGAQSHTVTNTYTTNRGYAIDAVVLVPKVAGKYLIEDENQLYTVSGGALVAVSGSLSAALFESDGFDDLSDADGLLETLTAPKVHAWNIATPQTISASVQALPYPQSIISPAVNLIQSEIISVSNINAVSSGSPKVAVNVSGNGWIKYNGSAWVAASDGDGNTIGELQALSESVWSDLFDGETTFALRVTLSAATDVLTSLQFVFVTE